MHSVLGELTDSTNQAIAFPIYGLVWPVGAIIGCVLISDYDYRGLELLRAALYLVERFPDRLSPSQCSLTMPSSGTFMVFYI
jgi:hypothetical protein